MILLKLYNIRHLNILLYYIYYSYIFGMYVCDLVNLMTSIPMMTMSVGRCGEQLPSVLVWSWAQGLKC